MSSDKRVEEQKINEAYFGKEQKCRDDLHSSTAAALTSCKEALALVKSCWHTASTSGAFLTRMSGLLTSNSRVSTKLWSLRCRTQDRQASLHDTDIELAYAYHDVALGDHAIGRTSEAAGNYAIAEQIPVNARRHIGVEFFQSQYTKAPKQVQSYHLILLKQTGQTAAAADLERKMKSESN